MNKKDYKTLVDKIKRLIFKDGRPTYILAPLIGVSDKTLKRFMEYDGVNVYTVMLIADYFEIKLFGKNSENVD